MGILSALLFGQTPKQQVDIPAMIKNGALVIDARTQGEFDSGHISGAILIPYDIIGQQIARHAKTKEQPVIVYCRSGARSGHARKTLLHMGYAHVVNGGSLHRMRKILEK